MPDRQRLQRSPLPVAFGVVGSVCLLGAAALAQTATTHNPVTRVDAYGSLRPAPRNRRSFGVFQNEIQRQALRGYQTRRRTGARRTGLAPLTTRRTLYGPAGAGLTAGSTSPYLPGDSLRRRQPGSGGYQGFGRGSAGQGDLLVALSRRSALLATTSPGAFVRRTLPGTGAALGTPSSGDGPLTAPYGKGDSEVVGLRLDERLRAGADLAHQRVRAGAWRHFREGDYRRASRAFETAVLLQPSDAESRIGELFCHLSVEAVRTAVAVMGQLVRRDPNPFLHDLDLTSAYGDAADARRVRIQAQFQANAAEEGANLIALNVLVLWYTGDRDEAVSAAAALVRDTPNSPYADWPAKLRSARSVLTAQPDQSDR